MGLIKKFRKRRVGARMQWPIPYSDKNNIDDLHLRDPFILPDGKGNYFMTGTIYRFTLNDSYGVVLYKSTDLKTWKGPKMIVRKEELPMECKDFWAPEIHLVDGKYCLFVTLHPKGEKRGTFLFTAEKPDGEYRVVCRVTPEDKNCLDATIWEEDGNLWITYCYEFIDCKNGEIRAVQLLPDWSGISPETDRLLFRASDNTFSPTSSLYKVTDGPFYFKKGEDLYMLWSTHVKHYKYVQLLAKSSNGRIDGDWQQLPPLYTEDGGHGMIFETYEGEKKLVLHAPNGRKILKNKFEHPLILEVDQFDF